MQNTIAKLLFLFSFGVGVFGQSTNSEVLGTITDASNAVVSDAKITIKSLDTGISRELVSNAEGKFRLAQLQPGNYSIQVAKTGFGTLTQGPVVLRLGQAAEFNLKLQVSGVAETVNVSGDAPLINTTNSEVGQNFESKRIAELPLAPNRNILNLALNVAGVSQLSSGQSDFASGLSFSVNGARTRSNNFMLDGQDVNDPSVTGSSQPINNPDTVAEFRVITSQFSAEYGRSSGSVISIITKSGSNDLHGSAFWFHNSNALNARSNQDKRTFQRTPFRNENQTGGTVGGPVKKNKTFFFGAYQSWWDRQLGSGSVINGAPTEEGKALLAPFAGSRPALKALLDFLPAGVPAGVASEQVVIGGQTLTIPRGQLAGAAPLARDETQWLVKVDHNLNESNRLSFRYSDVDSLSTSGQATPPGLTTIAPSKPRSATASWNWTVSPRLYTEFRAGFARQDTASNAVDPRSEAIPSLEVNSLGLTGFNAAASRTAIGLAVNLPQSRVNNTYQLIYTVGYTMGSHRFKAGIDVRQQHIKSFFVPTLRGRLNYETLQRLVDDQAQSAAINAPLRGGQVNQYYRFNDYMFFLQDEWRMTRNLSLNYGIRYENPGNPFADLAQLSTRIVAANNNDPRYAMDKAPGRDSNNWMPRVGFNYRLNSSAGMLGTLLGQDKTVIRGGYARTFDFAFINIALNIFSAFPFLNSVSLPGNTPNSYTALQQAPLLPITNPNLLTRTITTSDFRSPYAEQFSMNVQRQVANDWALTVGWVGTKGTALFQTLDGNPNTLQATNPTVQRVDPTRGVIRTRANAASSIYHSLQMSAEKRYSKGYLIGAHYTWSSFIDSASEIFNPAVSGDVAVAQDSFNRRNDRGRSTYDRPHRLTTTFLYDTPKTGLLSRVLPGVQFNGFLTLQSGAPFTPLNGTDPYLRLSGIDSLVGNAIRPNVLPGVSLAGRSINELYAVRTQLFSPVTLQNSTTGFGNAGRNSLRADGIANLDLGIQRNFDIIPDRFRAQLRADMFDVTNTKNFGIPESRINSGNFLNQWGTDGGRRRIQLALRFTF